MGQESAGEEAPDVTGARTLNRPEPEADSDTDTGGLDDTAPAGGGKNPDVSQASSASQS